MSDSSDDATARIVAATLARACCRDGSTFFGLRIAAAILPSGPSRRPRGGSPAADFPHSTKPVPIRAVIRRTHAIASSLQPRSEWRKRGEPQPSFDGHAVSPFRLRVLL